MRVKAMKNSFTYEYYEYYVDIVAEEMTTASFDLVAGEIPYLNV